MSAEKTGATPTVMGRLLRSWGIALAAAVFLAMSGAMGMSDMPMWQRFAYWGPVMVLVTPIGLMADPVLQRLPFLDGRPFSQWAVLSVIIALPITLVVWLYSSAFTGRSFHLAHITDYVGATLLITAAMTGIAILTERPGAVTHGPPRQDNGAGARARFLDRFPVKLMGAELFAVKSEDHYLRLYTSKGEDLILMRLVDAIGELEGIEGAQTHRSWWVSKEAVKDVRRKDGKVSLMLPAGVEAPVSRANVKGLREAGWI